MKIFKMTINEVEADPFVCVSSYKTPRREKKVEYYLSEDLAKQKQKEFYEGLQKLLGWIPKAECIIEPIEVIE